MMKKEAMEKICKSVLRKIRPSKREKEEVLSFSGALANKLREKLRSKNIIAEVMVEGSVAKDTWLARDKDIDLFILLPRKYPKEVFLKVLEVVKDFVGRGWREVYAEHPYIEADLSGYTVDFVPCFKIGKAEEVVSSADRSPLHTAYVKEHLSEAMKDEVRLLKRFMRGVNVYGAEIKVKGFSGYAGEVLVLSYGSFLDVLKVASKWRHGQVVDVERFYEGREEEARILFDSPLIVVDPIDKNRNVAAAVSMKKLGEFVAASKAFLSFPREEFFYPPETMPFTVPDLLREFETRGTEMVFLVFSGVEVAPDVLWGQLWKSLESLRKLLKQHDFQGINASAWSDEQEVNVLFFELEDVLISPSRKHIGPPVLSGDAEKFLKKHVGAERTISGPWIEDGRWVVLLRRRFNDATLLLRDKLKNGGVRVGVANRLVRSIRENLRILKNGEISDFYFSNPDFARFLTDYLQGRPKWLSC